MVSSFTQNYGLENPAIGDQVNSWGTTENSGRSQVDQALAGFLSFSVAGSSNVVLADSQGAVSQAKNAHFIFTGALTGNIVVLWPNGRGRVFSVSNQTTGNFSITIAVNNGSGGAAGTTYIVPQDGSVTECVSDGTNILQRAPSTATGVPTGTVFPFAGASAPTGFVLCNGGAIGRSAFAALFALVGTTYGAGDGSTTFNVPDLRGRTVAGFDSGNATGRLTAAASGGVSAAALGNAGGEQAHALSVAELASHNHGVSDPGHGHGVSDPTHSHGVNDPTHSHGGVTPTGSWSGSFGTQYVVSSVNNNAGGTAGGTVAASTGVSLNAASTGVSVNSATSGISTNAAGSGGGHNTVPPTIVLNYIIKT